MPKAKSKRRPHNERSRGPSRQSSEQASSAASHSLASTRMQVNESDAVSSPSSVATPQGSASQGMLVESLLRSQLLQTLLAKVADEVSRRFA